MLEGKPLFPGKDHVNQFSIITELLGTPPEDVIGPSRWTACMVLTACRHNLQRERALDLPDARG